MARVTCRCGEKLKIPPDAPERIECPKCAARIRLRRPASPPTRNETGDGYLRFLCPCGRRLKVPAAGRPVAGRCPDCGRVVPVPPPAHTAANAISAKMPRAADPQARTDELDASDLHDLEQWATRHVTDMGQVSGLLTTTTSFFTPPVSDEPNADLGLPTPALSPPSVARFEAGLRICPRCKKPVHLGALNCRECGTPVPRS
jgi:hypothetical protein